jgi:hypothetical protein
MVSLVDGFVASEGFRQGDPLLPYLFLLMVNTLQALIKQSAQHTLVEKGTMPTPLFIPQAVLVITCL